MADSTKHPPIHGGTLFSELKSVFSILRTRRTVAFAYGFMFAFLAFTVFLIFSPSSSTPSSSSTSSSPWFSNIFSTSSPSSTDSYRSQFSSIFTYFFPNTNDINYADSSSTVPSSEQAQNSTSPSSSDVASFRSNVTASQPSSTVKNDTLGSVNSPQATVLTANQTTNAQNTANSTKNSSSQLNQAKNATQDKVNAEIPQVAKQNQTSIPTPSSSPPSVSPPKDFSPPPAKNDTGKSAKSVVEKQIKSNYTASLSKKQNTTSTVSGASVAVKPGNGDDLIESLKKCDLFDGRWVEDDSYPLYKPGSCSLIDEQFGCILNGRPDKDYQKYRWQPKGCILPRLNASHMLEMLRGKRLVFVGDSLNRNMWESLVCMLRGSVKDQSKVYEANGRQHFRGEASYSFIFKDYGCTVEFFVSPFLVREWEMPDKHGSKRETLRLDLVGRSSHEYKGADIIVFNTGHWWTHDKTSKGRDYYQEGSHVYSELNVLEAFRRALTTWGRWVDANVNPTKSLVFFRGYSESHFSGGQWNSGGQCDHETQPIKNDTYLREYPDKMIVLERVLKGMKTHVTFLNITRMTDYRKDGHPSIYRKRHLTDAERRSPLMFQDCSHWCLPGVPDAWNELLYAELLVKLNEKEQQLKRP